MTRGWKPAGAACGIALQVFAQVPAAYAHGGGGSCGGHAMRGDGPPASAPQQASTPSSVPGSGQQAASGSGRYTQASAQGASGGATQSGGDANGAPTQTSLDTSTPGGFQRWVAPASSAGSYASVRAPASSGVAARSPSADTPAIDLSAVPTELTFSPPRVQAPIVPPAPRKPPAPQPPEIPLPSEALPAFLSALP
jgi:hypothetical protein